MRAFYTKTTSGLAPADDAAREAFARVKLGALVVVEVTRPRNIQRHRLWWALCRRIAQAVGGDLTADNVSDLLKVGTGHCRIIKGKRDTYKLPLSISFSNMDEDEFAGLMDRATVFIAEQWLPTLPVSDARREIENILFQEQNDVA